jgi:hypothetical protein
MKFVQLRTAQDLKKFQSLTKKIHHTEFPINYLKRSKVIVLMDDQKKICGGYALAIKAPFRSMEYLDPKIIKAEPYFKDYSLDDIFEINCLWLDPKMTSRGTSFHFWIRLYRDMISLRKKAFIYTYELNRPHLGRIYSMAKPKLIYRGKTPRLEGNTLEDWNVIEMAAVKNLYLAPIRSPNFLLKRLLLGKWTKKINKGQPKILKGAHL